MSQINDELFDKKEMFMSFNVLEKSLDFKKTKEKEAGFQFDHIFKISSSKEDRVGDTINQSGWNLKNYLSEDTKTGIKSGPVLFGHDYDKVIGKSYVWVEKDGLYGGVKYATGIKGYELPETVKGLVDGGFIDKSSVGFKPIDAVRNKTGVDFKEQELLEWSIVAVPANPDATLAMKQLGIDVVKAENFGVVKVLKKKGEIEIETKEVSEIVQKVTINKSDYEKILEISENRKAFNKLYRKYIKELRDMFELPILKIQGIDGEEKSLLQLCSIVRSLYQTDIDTQANLEKHVTHVIFKKDKDNQSD